MNNWFTLKEIKKNIWGIGEFGHFEKVISYLIVGENKALLFDTGMGIGNIKAVIKQLTKLPITILNSHSHFDHIGGNSNFNDILIYNHLLSKRVAKSGYSHFQLITNIENKLFLKHYPEEFDKHKYKIYPFKWKRTVNDSEIIKISPFYFKIIHTPGHSPDSLCLYEEKLGYLFSGDTIYPGPIYLNFTNSSLKKYKESILKLSKLSKIKFIFPAHNAFNQNHNIISELMHKIPINNVIKIIKINNKTSLMI